jgi:hypothetical protein
VNSRIFSVLFRSRTARPLKPHRGNIVPLALTLAALALNLSAIPETKAVSWVTNGPLTTACYDHTATLLPNGTLLVAGGYNTTSTFSIAEL